MNKHEENALLLCITGLSLGALIFIAIYQISAIILLTIVITTILLFSSFYGGIYFLSDKYDQEKAILESYKAEQEKRKMDIAELQTQQMSKEKTRFKNNTFTLDEVEEYAKEKEKDVIPF